MRKRIAAGILAAAAVVMNAPSAQAAPPNDAILTQAVAQAIASTSPAYLYALADPAGSTTAAEVDTRRPLLVADTGSPGDPVVFDGALATFGGGQYLRHGPAVKLNSHGPGAGGYRSFSMEATFTAPANMPLGTQVVAAASNWRLTLTATGSGVYAGWKDSGDRKVRLDRADDVATGLHQLVAVGSHRTMTFYVDGREAFTSPMNRLQRGVLSVGSFDGDPAGEVLTEGATVRDVAAWKRPLTAGEVSTLWAAAAS